MSSIACEECSEQFQPRNSRQRFCQAKCRYAAKDRMRSAECAHCGLAMSYSGKHVPGVSMHQACRREVTGHGATRYQAGCRCEICVVEGREYLRQHRAAYKAKHGEHPTTAYRRRYRAKHGHNPPRTGNWIDDRIRFEIYARDSWTCLLCGNPIDQDAHWNDNLAPSLDHIVPRSAGGSHDPSNLRTAHRSCNSVRGISTY